MPVVLTDDVGHRVLLYGADGSTLRQVVVDSSGHLQVDALSSALPAGAATLAEQQTQTVALQLIDDLRAALASVATDELRIADPRERALSQVVRDYLAGGVAPHADTVRFTYTVPAARLAIVELLSMQLLRDGVATSAGLAGAFVEVIPSGASAIRIYALEFQDNTLSYRLSHAVAGALWLEAGDTIRLQTFDASSGGTLRLIMGLAAIEFDA